MQNLRVRHIARFSEESNHNKPTSSSAVNGQTGTYQQVFVGRWWACGANDGKLDLAVCNINSNSTTILLNNTH
jgi:hypothetical protein